MVRCILQNRTGTHFAMCKPMAHLLNWWSSHHHIKRQEEHNNMLLLPDMVLFCLYVIAPSKYNGQVQTLFSSLSLWLIRSQCLLGVLVLWYFARMRLLPYTSANCVLYAFLLHIVPLVSRDWQQRDSRHTCIALCPVSVGALSVLT